MRDFNNHGNINVDGDFNFSDNSSNVYKPLAECTNEELFAERPFRLENIKMEQTRKTKKRIPLYLTAVIGVCIAIFIFDDKLYSLFTGAMSLVIGIISLRTNLEYNEFQKIEMAAVKEIDIILKQRRATDW